MVPADSPKISRVPGYSGFYLTVASICLPGCHRLWLDFPIDSASLLRVLSVVLLPLVCRNIQGLGSSAFARHYLRNHCYFLLLRVLRCFSSPRLPGTSYHISCEMGCPIRISTDLWLFAPPRGFSQLITSFFASESLGILHTPFFTFFSIPLARGFVWVDFGLSFARFLSFFQYVKDLVVENNGFEPLTPCLQSRCSSQLS